MRAVSSKISPVAEPPELTRRWPRRNGSWCRAQRPEIEQPDRNACANAASTPLAAHAQSLANADVTSPAYTCSASMPVLILGKYHHRWRPV